MLHEYRRAELGRHLITVLHRIKVVSWLRSDPASATQSNNGGMLISTLPEISLQEGQVNVCCQMLIQNHHFA